MNIHSTIARIQSLDKKVMFGVSAAIALAVLAAGYALFVKEDARTSPQKTETPVEVTAITVEPETINSVISAAGTLSSRNSSVLSSKIMGNVVELTVQEGSRVAEGDLLVRIESGEISAQLYQAQAAYNNARLQHERMKSLFAVQAATQMEMDQAILGLESAGAGLNAARAMESYTLITAPISGRIVEKRINLGEMALPGQPILKIEDNRNLRLEATIREQDIGFVQPGKSVTVRIDALPGKELEARVAQVVPAADVRTHSFVVKIDIPLDKGLMSGMYGKALFTTGTREAIFVPRSAVVEMSGLAGVYLVSADNSAVFQMIQPGETLGDSIEAVTGLKAGDRVIVNRPATSIEGRKVVVAGR